LFHAAEPAPEPAESQRGVYVTCARLAVELGIPANRLRELLPLWRLTDFHGWIENTERGGTDPARYLYSISHARKLLGSPELVKEFVRQAKATLRERARRPEG
jgi:hypothetical protein